MKGIRQRRYSQPFEVLTPNWWVRVKVNVPARVADAGTAEHAFDAAREVEPAIRRDLDENEASIGVVDVIVAADEAVTTTVSVGQTVVEFSVVEEHRG
jgi:hypothetical protein